MTACLPACLCRRHLGELKLALVFLQAKRCRLLDTESDPFSRTKEQDQEENSPLSTKKKKDDSGTPLKELTVGG